MPYCTRSRARSPMTSSRHYDRSHSPCNNSTQEENVCRIYVTDLSPDCTKHEIENAFSKWSLVEVWHAQASCFAFVVLRHREDGQQAISEFDGGYIGNARVRASFARPRTRTGKRKHFDPNMRCYQCGSRGHLSRDCVANEQRDKNKNCNHRSNTDDHYRKRSRSRSHSRVTRNSRDYSLRRRTPSPYYKVRENRSGYFTSPPRP